MGLEDRDYMREPGSGTRRGAPSIKDRSPSWEYSASGNAGSSARRSASVGTTEGIARERVLVGLAWCCAAQALCVALVAASAGFDMLEWIGELAMPCATGLLLPIAVLTFIGAAMIPSPKGNASARALLIAALPAFLGLGLALLLHLLEPEWAAGLYLGSLGEGIPWGSGFGRFYLWMAVICYWLAAPAFALAGCFTHPRSPLSWDLAISSGGERRYPIRLGTAQLSPVIVAGTLLVLYALGMKGLGEVVLEMMTWSWLMFLAKLGFVGVSLYVAALAAGQANRSAMRG
jgi:hypothetical protein